MCRDEEKIEGGSSSQISPDFLPQNGTNVYVYGNTTVNDMHNVNTMVNDMHNVTWFKDGLEWTFT